MKDNNLIERMVNETEYSKVVTIKKSEGPVVGIVGLCHGDEICGRIVLDEFQNIVPDCGTVKLIYANLPAEKAKKRFVEANLNRVFPGNPDGKLEEKIASALQSELSECDYVIDIHATIDPSPAFAISSVNSKEFYELAMCTGLDKYVIMTDKLANGKSLIDYVNSTGGKGISFEAGEMDKQASVDIAMKVVRNFLAALGVVKQEFTLSNPETYHAKEVVIAPSLSFIPIFAPGFELLRAGTPYGIDGDKKYSLDHDTYPILSMKTPLEGMVFLKADKV